jgi:hypothetical protein
MDLQAQVEGIVAKLRGDVEALAQALQPGGPGLDPGELERRCRAVGLTLAHELLALLWPRYGTGDQGPAVRCACGGTRRRVGCRPRRLRDLMNHRLTVARTYYFCRTCGQGWLPLDETLGLPRVAATPALFEAAVTCGSVAPPEEAADLLARLAGVTFSPKSVERYTKATGRAVERAVDQRAQRCQADPTPDRPGPPVTPARPYNVQFDGSMLRLRDRAFREVKVGCLFDARDLAQVQAGRRELLRKHHEVYLGGPEPLGWHMYAAARAAGVTADGSNAISQGDGAPWVWHLVQLHWPAAREVLDYYHLSEHLHTCAQALWGVGSERAQTWAREVGVQTLNGDAGVLRQALGRLRPTNPALRPDPCQPPGLRKPARRGLRRRQCRRRERPPQPGPAPLQTPRATVERTGRPCHPRGPPPVVQPPLLRRRHHPRHRSLPGRPRLPPPGRVSATNLASALAAGTLVGGRVVW